MWSLVSWRQFRGEQVVLPMGDRPVGRLIYTADGWLSVNIMRGERPRMTTGDFVTASASEKVAAFEGYMGYSGRYELRDDEVIHQIDCASYPNWVGDAQVRRPTVGSGLLVLEAAVRMVQGVPVSATLEWRKQ
ncbi:lipocalin-like domain-containing protein [Ramlibacter albus]|uniref:Lipocalin-like domain-containing protein n=1 Tax=Ramlibacter albus TaxID=2079448 RepID=A0A923S0B0_9BURK|nr:lipocalin-like domain-containing protein [Ramlibacter albus]